MVTNILTTLGATFFTIGAKLLPMLGTDVLLCTDASGAYASIARAGSSCTEDGR